MKSQPATALRPSSVRKRQAMIEAGAVSFLRDGFRAASMDEIAKRAGVSKQTLYTHFGNKKKLFVAVVDDRTAAASERVRAALADHREGTDVQQYLEDIARTLLDAVLVPDLIELRRLVIGESSRFPELAQAFWAGGPERAITEIAERLDRLTADGLLSASDAHLAATNFNWLVMAAPLNAAMMLDRTLPTARARHRHAAEATRVFWAAYGRPVAG
jgi:AcrR family transcriptional regulator